MKKILDELYFGNIVPDEQYIVKPMNCPFHILIYQSQRHSYRDLPLRMGELGTVYRREKSGALSGLTRVQGFTQDDAHIFCTPEQLVDEINEIIDFVADTMKIFNMGFEVELSTRPESYVGDIKNWEIAEAGLKEAMDKRGMTYEINEGDGAFYGPKIDFKVKDALGRTWQCATIQLDFNLPERFEIKYQDKDGQLKTPVMLHRVIFGSMERFHGILIEHFAGAFPTWLAPTQVVVMPVNTEFQGEYAKEVYNLLRDNDIRFGRGFRRSQDLQLTYESMIHANSLYSPRVFSLFAHRQQCSLSRFSVCRGRKDNCHQCFGLLCQKG